MKLATRHSRASKQLIITGLVMKLPVLTEPESALQCSQKPVTVSISDPDIAISYRHASNLFQLPKNITSVS
jgi:hypothetical protein